MVGWLVGACVRSWVGVLVCVFIAAVVRVLVGVMVGVGWLVRFIVRWCVDHFFWSLGLLDLGLHLDGLSGRRTRPPKWFSPRSFMCDT